MVSIMSSFWRVMAFESFVLGIWIDFVIKDRTAGLLAVLAGVLFWVGGIKRKEGVKDGFQGR